MKYLKKYNESLNESEIHSICKKYRIKNYTINEDGSIDVNGDVYLREKGLTKLPLHFRNVSGGFSCRNNQLSGFYCQDNQLTSLEGAPKSVDSSFNCQNSSK